MIVIHVITLEVETIKRQAGTVYSCLAVRLARVCGLSLQPIGCTVRPSLQQTALRKLQLPLVALYKCYTFTFYLLLTYLHTYATIKRTKLSVQQQRPESHF